MPTITGVERARKCIETLVNGIEQIKSYPKKGHPRRAYDGIPSEISYDRFAYARMIRSIRRSLRDVLTHSKAKSVLKSLNACK